MKLNELSDAIFSVIISKIKNKEQDYTLWSDSNSGIYGYEDPAPIWAILIETC